MLIVRRTTLRPNDASGDDETLQLAARLVAETEGEELHPNLARARPLGDAPAMRRVYGKEIDPDSVRSGGAVDAAIDRYEIFHQKHPIDLRELQHDLPKKLVCIGDALAVAYRTDKWKEDGNDEDYKHVHEKRTGGLYKTGKGVKFYEPAGEYQKSRLRSNFARSEMPDLRVQGPPVRYPNALTRLGYCLGAWVRRYDVPDGENAYFSTHPRGCDLYCSPSGDMLAIYSPKQQSDGSVGFLAVMAGGNLRVVGDGIDG